jgi:hypothetical protein
MWIPASNGPCAGILPGLEPDINSGTYTIYITIEPVYKAPLLGTGPYKTLEVSLTESTNPEGSVSSELSYTFNHEMYTSVFTRVLKITTPPWYQQWC